MSRLEERRARIRARQPRSDADRASTAQSRAFDETDTMNRPFMDNWSPPNALEVPPDNADYTYRWVREYVNGQADHRNVQMRLREGYVRVNISELPDTLLSAVDEDVRGDGVARTGGLILMKLPLKFAEQRRRFYRRRAQSASQAADELQGVAGSNFVREDRGSRSIEGSDAGRFLQQMSQR